MIIYQVLTTEKTAGFTESVFLDTISGVFVETPGTGFFKHPTIKTAEDLKKHLQQMKEDGFKITKTVRTCKA